MKNVFLIILYFLLIFEGNAQGSSSSHSNYDYTSYSVISANENLSNAFLESSSSKESVVYVTSPGISISNSILQKTGGDTADEDIKDSEFYGVNAADLVNGGEVTITGGYISAQAKGANVVCATNSGKVTISGTTIESSATQYARGLHATYNGRITASNALISSQGESCALLSTCKEEGTISCTGCGLSSSESGSPLIYSAGTITLVELEEQPVGLNVLLLKEKVQQLYKIIQI